jgi:hypothetical protein
MCCLPLVPLTLWSGPAVACACTFFFLLLNPVGNAGIGSYRMAVTPDHLQGRVSSASQFASMSVMPLSPLLGGWLLERLGGESTMSILVACTALLALLLSSSRSIRSVPKPSEWVRAQKQPQAPAPAI